MKTVQEILNTFSPSDRKKVECRTAELIAEEVAMHKQRKARKRKLKPPSVEPIVKTKP